MRNTATDPLAAPVIVVGAGPVGMTAAAMLAKLDVPVVVVEREPEHKTDWRASTFHPPTLELLDQLGITARMVAEGLAVPTYQYRDRQQGVIAEFDFGLLSDETPYPYRLQLNQQHLVRFLYEQLSREPNARLLFGARVINVVNTPDGVSVDVESGGKVNRIDARYLIAADGASSTVRESLGITFEGHTYPERFVIASTSKNLRDLIPDIADVNYIADPREWLFVLRTPEAWRVVWPVPPAHNRDEALSAEAIQSHLFGVAECPGGYPVIDRQIYNVHQRVAATFWSGSTFLVGDAAHINSPVGGVGLNSGIHDAIDITTRLGRVLTGGADDAAEFEMFARIRRQVAVEYVQADTHRNTERLAETDESLRARNQVELQAIAADPAKARAWVRRVSLLESVRRFGVGVAPRAALAVMAKESL